MRCYNQHMPFPRMLLVRQHFPDRRIPDLDAALGRELEQSALAERLRQGSRVAIGCGSRGIANLAAIVRAVVHYFRSKGSQPFVFPAMGSHGAATAQGQAAVLEHYGITEAFIGCSIASSLDVVSLGSTPDGLQVYLDRLAAESDAIFLINRIKWHTSFEGKIESGLFKMMAIGLGKHAGAQAYHSWAHHLGLEEVICRIGRHLLASGKILGGLAIVEDAYHNTAKVQVVPAEEMEKREEELLALAKSWMGRLPCDLDILILDQIGKDISGTGMDTKVVNRSIEGAYNPWPGFPRVGRIFVRDISELSYGNAVGIGMADVVADRVLPKINWEATHINSLTASTPAGARLPIHFPTDRVCLEKIWPTAGKFRPEELAIGWIHNTLKLDLLALSQNLLSEIEPNPALEVLGSAFELPFDSHGNLLSPLEDVQPPADKGLRAGSRRPADRLPRRS